MATSKINSFKRKIFRVKHIGLDTMCFIYQFANHPRYAPLTHIIFNRLQTKRFHATTSTISLIETLVQPERRRQPELVAEYLKVFDLYPNLEVLAVDTSIAQLSAKLRALYPAIRTPDAIQLSAAIINRCGLFITNDKKLLQVKQIPVVLLSDYTDK